MIDPLGVTVGAVGLLENFDKIIKAYYSNTSQHFKEIDGIFGELQILQSVLVESKLITDELADPPPSCVIALLRCQELQREFAYLLDKAGLTGAGSAAPTLKLRVKYNIGQVNTVFSSLKSAVLLFRDISTDALTHHLLRTAKGHSMTIYGNAIIGHDTPDIGTMQQGTKVTPNTTSAPNSQAETNPGERQNEALIRKPLEKSTLFNATISLIADADLSKLSESVRNSTRFGSPCTCGRQRGGIWFPVRGKFDSGSGANFVSDTVIERAGLKAFVSKARNRMSFRVLGVTFDFHQTITLSWQLNNHETSYTTDFWVANQADNFDLIIGEPFLMEHGYEFIETHRSREQSSFFGFFPWKLHNSSKAQSERERQTREQNRIQALADLHNSRLAALIPGPIQVVPAPPPQAAPNQAAPNQVTPNQAAPNQAGGP